MVLILATVGSRASASITPFERCRDVFNTKEVNFCKRCNPYALLAPINIPRQLLLGLVGRIKPLALLVAAPTPLRASLIVLKPMTLLVARSATTRWHTCDIKIGLCRFPRLTSNFPRFQCLKAFMHPMAHHQWSGLRHRAALQQTHFRCTGKMAVFKG